MRNLNLVSLLARDALASHRTRVTALREFAPLTRPQEWRILRAGQRAQIVKPGAGGHGVLQFGTEVITSAEGTLAGVLDASPGASTAVPIARDILTRCFPTRINRWTENCLQEHIPHLGAHLDADERLTQRARERISSGLDTPSAGVTLQAREPSNSPKASHSQ